MQNREIVTTKLMYQVSLAALETKPPLLLTPTY